MTRRLFGTDGIRGEAFVPPLDEPTVTRLGRVLAEHLAASGQPTRILLAGDTRASTPTLAQWLGGAFRGAGGEVVWAGVLPTPAVSHLLRGSGGFGAGVVISASHNPARDNGIKLLGAGGTKWPEAEEQALEERLGALAGAVTQAPLPALARHWQERYLSWLSRTLDGATLEGLRVLVDAANGAGSGLAEELFSRLGAQVEGIFSAPDGGNINQDCGAVHPQALAATVVARRAHVGVALDGDADRAILVTHTGRILDGDEILLLWGSHLAEVGRLPGRVVVATVMSNLGLERALGARGIRLLRCPVGDREVWAAMEASGAALGGEQSGHVICAHHSVTGDGLLTACHVLSLLHGRGASLEEAARLQRFPQVLLNVKVASRRPLTELPQLTSAIAAAERSFTGGGRVLVRYSGTEPLLRIMVEAARREEALSVAESLAELARRSCGGIGAGGDEEAAQ
ncbi:MAG: phosphoglucosamine mutase [Thermoanaerobaculaceae bacterium]|nr:phosphoglucosamine mutase [Thermoanaerobaculaceae bacterium]